MSISAFIPVFNEETRISYALASLSWCNEIIVVDKFSTDRTVEIATGYGARVFSMPNSDTYNADEFDFLVRNCSSEWVIIFTASDIMDVELGLEIKKLTSDPGFGYDILEIPLKRYVLGIEDKRSPWHGRFYSKIFRKSILEIKKDDVHGALHLNSSNRFVINYLQGATMSHLTHANADIMMERHLRYWRAEAINYQDPTLKRAFIDIIRAIRYLLLQKKTFLLGWNGVAIMCAYLSYPMISFIYKWERKNNHAAEIYKQLRDQSARNWQSASPPGLHQANRESSHHTNDL